MKLTELFIIKSNSDNEFDIDSDYEVETEDENEEFEEIELVEELSEEVETEEMESEEVESEEVELRDDDEDEEEELNQGPGAKPAENFTSGAFVVFKTDMVNVGQENPPIWKIDGKVLLQKYVAFKQDEKILYRNTQTYSNWNSNLKNLFYSAPVSFIKQTQNEHIIEFFKDKVNRDPDGEEAAKKEDEEKQN